VFDAIAPEYLHVVTNHIPILGMLAAAVPLLIGVIWKSRAALAAGLVLVMLAALGMSVTMWAGEEAEHRFESSPALEAVAGEAGMDYLHEHEERAELGSKVFYGVGGVAAVAFILLFAYPRANRIAGVVVLIGALGCFGLSLWVAQPGGRINHPELRPGFWETHDPPAERD